MGRCREKTGRRDRQAVAFKKNKKLSPAKRTCTFRCSPLLYQSTGQAGTVTYLSQEITARWYTKVKKESVWLGKGFFIFNCYSLQIAASSLLSASARCPPPSFWEMSLTGMAPRYICSTSWTASKPFALLIDVHHHCQTDVLLDDRTSDGLGASEKALWLFFRQAVRRSEFFLCPMALYWLRAQNAFPAAETYFCGEDCIIVR